MQSSLRLEHGHLFRTLGPDGSVLSTLNVLTLWENRPRLWCADCVEQLSNFVSQKLDLAGVRILQETTRYDLKLKEVQCYQLFMMLPRLWCNIWERGRSCLLWTGQQVIADFWFLIWANHVQYGVDICGTWFPAHPKCQDKVWFSLTSGTIVRLKWWKVIDTIIVQALCIMPLKCIFETET